MGDGGGRDGERDGVSIPGTTPVSFRTCTVVIDSPEIPVERIDPPVE